MEMTGPLNGCVDCVAGAVQGRLHMPLVVPATYTAEQICPDLVHLKDSTEGTEGP